MPEPKKTDALISVERAALRQILIPPEDFPSYFKGRADGKTIVEFAEYLGVTPHTVYVLLSGALKPSAKILEKLGLIVLYASTPSSANALVVNPDQFPSYLLGRRGDKTLVEFAEDLGISRQMAHNLLAGIRKPSAKILRKLGLMVAFASAKPFRWRGADTVQ